MRFRTYPIPNVITDYKGVLKLYYRLLLPQRRNMGILAVVNLVSVSLMNYVSLSQVNNVTQQLAYHESLGEEDMAYRHQKIAEDRTRRELLKRKQQQQQHPLPATPPPPTSSVE